MTFYIAADHAGFLLKQQILNAYPDMIDLGADSSESVDYPDFAQKLAREIGKYDFGILICGSGIGICIAANRFKHVRAANCISSEMAMLARVHNDANVLCLPGRLLSTPDALMIIDTFLTTSFSQEYRHQNRINKMSL